jgi:valyl-tRNA synthetase
VISLDSSEERWVAAYTEAEATAKAQKKFNLTQGSFKLEQDPDVLDTWFSSALFPLTAFGWPRNDNEVHV